MLVLLLATALSFNDKEMCDWSKCVRVARARGSECPLGSFLGDRSEDQEIALSVVAGSGGTRGGGSSSSSSSSSSGSSRRCLDRQGVPYGTSYMCCRLPHGATSRRAAHTCALPGGAAAWCKHSRIMCVARAARAMTRFCCNRAARAGAPPPQPLCAQVPVDGGWGAFGGCSKPCGYGVQFRRCNLPAPSAAGAPCQGRSVRGCNEVPCSAATATTADDGAGGGAGGASGCHNDHASHARCRLLAAAMRHPGKAPAVRRAFCRPGREEFLLCAKTCGRCQQSAAQGAAARASAAQALLLRSGPPPPCVDSVEFVAGVAWSDRCPLLAMAMAVTADATGAAVRAKQCVLGNDHYNRCRSSCCSMPACAGAPCEIERERETRAKAAAASAAASASAAAATVAELTHAISAAGDGTVPPEAWSSTPIDGGWAAWSACTATCGRTAHQVRSCTQPAPQWGGAWCAGDDGLPLQGDRSLLRQKRTCFEGVPCPVDGGWSAWSPCSVTCGAHGVQLRQCNSPAPERGGALCDITGVGARRSCHGSYRVCPIDGRWGSWQVCSDDCGGGTQDRACDQPAPHAGGQACAGPAMRPCNEQACSAKKATDGGWGAWSTCSASCGAGGQHRRCDSPAPQNGGAPCVGSARQACNAPPCAVAGGWSPWSVCSVTCGLGLSARKCNLPAPRFGGAFCAGKAVRRCGPPGSGKHGERPCPVNGGYSAWEPCSSECGGGMKYRRCDSPRRAFGGRGCHRLGPKKRACNLAPCIVSAGAGVTVAQQTAELQQQKWKADYSRLMKKEVKGALKQLGDTAAAKALGKNWGDLDELELERRGQPGKVQGVTPVLRGTATAAANSCAAAAYVPLISCSDDRVCAALPLVPRATCSATRSHGRKTHVTGHCRCGSSRHGTAATVPGTVAPTAPPTHSPTPAPTYAPTVPVTDVAPHCVDATCAVRGQVCTDGGFICAGGDELNQRRPRHCPAGAPLCWVALHLHGSGGQKTSSGVNIIDCGTKFPTMCKSPGTLCADFSDLYRPWFICQSVVAPVLVSWGLSFSGTCKKSPCWELVRRSSRVKRTAR